MVHGVCRDCATWLHTVPEVCPHCSSGRLVEHRELADLDIAHVDCDAFYAAVEKRDNPCLRDKPVIVGGTSGRGVVTTACYIARRFGPRSAMPMFKALQLCPDAVVVPTNMAKYKAVSVEIREIFSAATDTIEPVSLDEAYLDLSPDARASEAPPAVALAEIARRVEDEVGITVSIGLSCNKFLAKLASDFDKPRGFSIIGRGEAKSVLAPLPANRIHGVGKATADKLDRLGIHTIADLQALPEAQVVGWFGKFGHRLARYVQGEDDRKVTPDRPTKSISSETTFRVDIRSCEELCDAVRPLCESVARRLLRSSLAGQTLVLKLKSADFRILTRNRRLANPSQRADVMLLNARQLIEKEADGRAFRLIGIGMSDLCPASEADPPDLFGWQDPAG